MIERTIVFGPNACLVGTLCLPTEDDDQPASVGLVLFNAGVLGRIGPHRLNVRMARALARRGVPSIRFDLSGMGDSQRSREGLPFEAQAEQDLRRAVDELCLAAGVSKVALFGFCSGGRYAYRLAPKHDKVVGVIMHDTYAHPTWRSRVQKYGHRIQHYGLSTVLGGWVLRGPGKLLKAITGGASRSASRARAVEADLSDSFALEPTRQQFAQRIGELHARGVKVGLIYSGEGEIYNYPDQHLDAYKGLGIDGLYTCDYLPHMDHNAMSMDVQKAFIGLVERWLLDLSQRRP